MHDQLQFVKSKNLFKVGGAFQWPPPKEDEGQEAVQSAFMDPNQSSQQNVQQTQQAYQQNVQSQQQSYSLQQQSSNQQTTQQNQTNGVSLQSQPQQQNWNGALNKDKAGQASNAEDFTKQFMGQMYGGQTQQASVPQQPSQPKPVSILKNTQPQSQESSNLAQQSMKSQQQSFSYQQQSSQQSSTMTQQTQPKPILKNTQPSPSQNTLQPDQSFQQETYSPGPGQQVTAPRRGKGELHQQQPGMRTPICGACDGQIRC